LFLILGILPRSDALRQYIYSSEAAGGINRSVKIELKGAQ